MTLAEKIWNGAVSGVINYGRTAALLKILPFKVTDNGDGTGTLCVDTELTATIDTTGLATSAGQASLLAKFPDQVGGKIPVDASVTIAGGATSAKQDTQITAEQAILAKIIAAPATEAKQDTIKTVLDNIKTDVDKIPSKGSSNMAGSMPVTLATDGPGVANLVTLAASFVALLSAVISISSSGDNTIITPTSGKALQIVHIVLVAASVVSIIPKLGTTSLSGAMPTLNMDISEKPYLWLGAANEAFKLTLGTGVAVTGFVLYREV